MSQNRRDNRIYQRELKAANKRHDPALRILVYNAIVYLEESKNCKKSQEVINELHLRWLTYCKKHKETNEDAFIDSLIFNMV